MKTTLHIKGTVVKGVKHYKLLQFTLLQYDNLPQAYLDDIPHVYSDTTQTQITLLSRGKGHEDAYSAHHYKLGDCYPENEIEHLINQLEIASKRLKNINSRIEKENEGWEEYERKIIF